MRNLLWLRAGSTQVAFDPQTGSLVVYDFEVSGREWSLIRRPELGLSFRLLVPLPDRRNNNVHGAAQMPPTVNADAGSVEFVWPVVVSEYGGQHDIAVTQRWALIGDRLSVSTEVDNRSDFVVENVFSPNIGDIQAPEPSESLVGISSDYGSATAQPLWPIFENTVGYHGTEIPTQFVGGKVPSNTTPNAPFRLLQAESAGLFVGTATSETDLIAWQAELWPGYGDTLEWRVPTSRVIADKPVHLRFAAVHVPFILPGEQRVLAPIVLEAYAGTWHSGADIYVELRDQWFAPAAGPAWIDEPHSWHQLQINSAEDDLRLPFNRLVEVGKEAAAAGVAAIQLVGFNDGGQDRNNPSHEPDIRLGGFDGLKSAITEIQALGVKVVLFSKFNWADRATEAFRTHFIADSIKDPYGDYYLHSGYKYETTTQLLDINTRRLVPMCFLYEGYLQECEKQFQILVDLGADGMLFDECFHHLPTLLCFDTAHGHRYGESVAANDVGLIQRLDEKAPDGFLYAGEGLYDLLFAAYSVSYIRSEDRRHTPLHRYIQPRAQIMTAITGFDDRNMVNQCLLYRYVISYEPFNFKGRLPDFPDTVCYGQQMDQLRRDARPWLWDGRCIDTLGASVIRSDGHAHQPYSVFVAADGTTALVIANYDENDITVTFNMPGGTAWTSRTIDEVGWSPVGGDTVTIPGRSARAIIPAVPTAPH